MKKKLSFALSLVLALAMILPLFPVFAQAEGLGDKDLYAELKEVNYCKTVYDSPEAKLATMTKAVENDKFALFVQEFTAEVCLVDKVTGQMLFTNPYDVADTTSSDAVKYELLSQVKLTYHSNKGDTGELDSYSDAAAAEQVSIKLIRGGVRVEYTIGEAIKKRMVPYMIEKSRFEEDLLKPLYESTTSSELSFEEYMTLKRSSDLADQAKATEAESFEYGQLFAFYELYDLSDPSLTARELSTILTIYPITEKYAIYVIDEDIIAQKLNDLEEYIREYTEFSLDDMLAAHEEVGYVMEDGSPAIFKLALEYTLEDDGMQVRLPARGISFDASTYTLDTVQILPYFGAGRTGAETAIRNDEGYNFIPDGSGATIAFDQNQKYTQVSGTLYGSDFGFYTGANPTTASYQIWRAPVYGTVMESNMDIYRDVLDAEGNPVKDADGNTVRELAEERKVKQGYVAFITEGESLTRIDAISGTGIHEYHSVSTTFFARQTDSYPLDGITVSGQSAVYTKAIERKYVGNYTIKYRMLKDEDANYVGMANTYREYLEENGVLKKLENKNKNIRLYMDLLGAIDTTKTVLGVPVETKADLTTFEDAKLILDELKEEGVSSQAVRYLGWMNGGMASTVPAKMKVVKQLGSKKELQDLIRYVQDEGNEIFLDLDFAYTNSTAMFDGYNEKDDAAKTIDGKAAFFQTYNPIVQAYNTQVAFVLSAKTIGSYYDKISEKYLDLFGEGKKTVSVGSLGYALNSSQDEDFPLNREDAKDYTAFALEEIKKDFDHLILEKGNYYTWKYADTVLDIPLDSSNRNTTTAEVPFLGILLHGYMNYTGEAINMAGDYEYTLLKTIESGANPYFVLAYKNIAELKKNGYSEYYAVEYAVWKDTIVEEYKKLNEVLSPLQNQIITGHDILQERVVRVTYENGTEIYLNYNNYAVTVEGLEIPAMGFQAEVA